MTSANDGSSGAIGVGYEGRDLSGFVDDLLAEGVTHLVDVRLTPISRKPGFSKTALSLALGKAGISYDHRPTLGNPKVNRAGFAGGPSELARARATFAHRISQPEAVEAIDDLARLAQETLVAILCFEADQSRCHRDVVLAEIAGRAVNALDSRRRAH